VKGGWIESAVVWISLVGEAGIGKTPSISRIIYPLEKINNGEIKKYIKNTKLYEAYMDLDKKEKQNNEEIKKPSKTQMIVSDFTIEAITDLHEENKNAVGVFCDELAGWYKDMNKYRAGSDLEFWLSSWSNKGIAMNRKTAKSSFVESPILPVLGGIQPKILVQFFTEENKDNGFIDRMLTTFPDAKVDEYNDDDLSEEIIQWYNDYVVNFYNVIKKHVIKYDPDGEIKSKIVPLSDGAKRLWIEVFNKITSHQNSDDENEYMKSMYPKQKSYIPRFALILNTLYAYDNTENSMDYISERSMAGAIKLSEYFVLMAKKHKLNTIEFSDVKKVVNQNENKSTKEKIFEILKKDPNTKVTYISSILGVSRKTVYQYINEIKND
jgi:ABC-type oligopeptide transport system ATPase subunit